MSLDEILDLALDSAKARLEEDGCDCGDQNDLPCALCLIEKAITLRASAITRAQRDETDQSRSDQPQPAVAPLTHAATTERVRGLLYQDAIRCADALIGEIDGAGSTQKKTGWMNQGWHRRLTWLRWMRELRGYLESKETMALALHIEIDRLREMVGSGTDSASAEHVDATRRSDSVIQDDQLAAPSVEGTEPPKGWT